MLAAGDTSPDFKLIDIHGHEKTLSDFARTKPALFAFFKVSCPVCQFTLPFLERLSQSDTLEVIGVSQDDNKATAKFRAAYGITFLTLLDDAKRGYPASNDYGIGTVPSLFLVEPGGEIALAGEGFARCDLEALGKIAGVEPFRAGEKIPEFRGG